MSYKTQMMKNHLGFAISCCVLFVSVAHPFLGASPDALIQCDCCGEGVVEINPPSDSQVENFKRNVYDKYLITSPIVFQI